MIGMIPLTYAVTRMAFPNESCGLSQRVAWTRRMSATASVMSLALTLATHTKGLIVGTQLHQARLQDLSRVFRSALALNVCKATPDGRQIFSDALELYNCQLPWYLVRWASYSARGYLCQCVRRRICIRCEAEGTRQKHAGQDTTRRQKKHLGKKAWANR